MDSKKLDNNIPVSEEIQNIKYDYFNFRRLYSKINIHKIL